MTKEDKMFTDRVITVVQQVTQIKNIKTKRRFRELVVARKVVCKILKDRMYPLSYIGQMLLIDHATVLHSLRNFDDKVQREEDLRFVYIKTLNVLKGMDDIKVVYDEDNAKLLKRVEELEIHYTTMKAKIEVLESENKKLKKDLSKGAVLKDHEYTMLKTVRNKLDTRNIDTFMVKLNGVLNTLINGTAIRH